MPHHLIKKSFDKYYIAPIDTWIEFVKRGDMTMQSFLHEHHDKSFPLEATGKDFELVLVSECHKKNQEVDFYLLCRLVLRTDKSYNLTKGLMILHQFKHQYYPIVKSLKQLI